LTDQSARILYVEDDPHVCWMIGEALREAGYAVDSAGTVADGQSLLDVSTYDLLLSDGRLPDGNGFSIATKAAAKGVKVLIYTGYMYEYSETDRASFTVLAKPIRISQLLQSIRDSLLNTSVVP
jgi:two-component system nitrogen regulation response regulator GlnG